MFYLNEVAQFVLTPTFKSHLDYGYRWTSENISQISTLSTGAIQIMQGTQLISQTNPLANGLSLVATTIGQIFPLINSVETNCQLWATKKEMLAKIGRPLEPLLPEEKVTVLTDSCHYVIEHGERLQSCLGIAEESKIITIARQILKDLSSNDANSQLLALEKGEKVMQILRQRIYLKLGVEVAKTALLATGVALSLLSICAPSPPTLILTGVVGVATVALWLFERLMLPKDPFSIALR